MPMRGRARLSWKVHHFRCGGIHHTGIMDSGESDIHALPDLHVPFEILGASLSSSGALLCPVNRVSRLPRDCESTARCSDAATGQTF